MCTKGAKSGRVTITDMCDKEAGGKSWALWQRQSRDLEWVKNDVNGDNSRCRGGGD